MFLTQLLVIVSDARTSPHSQQQHPFQPQRKVGCASHTHSHTHITVAETYKRTEWWRALEHLQICHSGHRVKRKGKGNLLGYSPDSSDHCFLVVQAAGLYHHALCLWASALAGKPLMTEGGNFCIWCCPLGPGAHSLVRGRIPRSFRVEQTARFPLMATHFSEARVALTSQLWSCHLPLFLDSLYGWGTTHPFKHKASEAFLLR